MMSPVERLAARTSQATGTRRWHEIARALDGATVAIIGAAGFLGQRLSWGLTSACEQFSTCVSLDLIDLFPRGEPQPATPPGVKIATRALDIRSPFSLDGADFVVHAASIPSPTAFRADPLATIDVNVNGTWRVLEACVVAKAKTLLVSTSGVYGDGTEHDGGSLSEDHRGWCALHDGRSCYDESKRMGETLAHEIHRRHGLSTTVCRPFNIYGPWQRLDDGRLIPHLLAAFLRGEEPVLDSNGEHRRAFCYVDDAIEALALALVKPSSWAVYNIGCETTTSVREVATLMADAFGPSAGEAMFLDRDRRGDGFGPTIRCPDTTRIRDELGWTARTSMTVGIASTVRLYREALEAGMLSELAL